MKSQTYLRFSLLFPYFLWGITTGLFAIYSSFPTVGETNPITDFIISVVALFSIGIFIWAVPYTILAFGLGLWSRDKPADKLAKVFAVSPLMMTFLVALEMVIFTFARSDGVAFDFWAPGLAVSLLSIPFGYVIIGIVAGVYKLMQLNNYIKPDNEPPHQPTN